MLEKSLKKLNKKAKKIFNIKKKKLKKLKISYDLNSFRILGLFNVNENTIYINNKLLIEIGEKKYYPILRHEFGHFLTNIIYPRAEAHGKEWKSIMKKLGDKNPSSKTSLLNEKIKQAYSNSFIIAHCKCSEHNISINKATRIKNKTNKYICKKCNSKINLSPKMEKN